MLNNKNSQLHVRPLRLHSVKQNNNKGGTIINIIVALVFLGLMAAGILWVMKTTGEAGSEYVQGMVNTQNKASVLKCQMNLQTIYKSIQLFAITSDKLPETFQELVDEVGDSRVFQCSEPNSPKFVYIPGQTLDSPPENILVYEPQPVHNGMSNVLRVNGSVDMFSPGQLQAAIDQTRAHLRK